MDEYDICYGDKVQLFDSQIGIVKYIGEISYGDPKNGRNKMGMFYGIELKSKHGQHNGSIRGRIYFKCPPRHGIFLRLKDIECMIKRSKHTSTRYHINQLIYIKNKDQIGTIKYIGLCPHLDNDSLWFGIELTSDYSRNKYQTKGTIQNIVYFTSSAGCNAIFIQSSNISHIPDEILEKIRADSPPALQLKQNHKKKKKKDKEDRRSSVFELLRKKLTGAMSTNKHIEPVTSNHIKSASTSIRLPKPITRKSRSYSTPKSPAIIAKNVAQKIPSIALPSTSSYKYDKSDHDEKEKSKKLNKHHEKRRQATLSPRTPNKRKNKRNTNTSMTLNNIRKAPFHRSQSADPEPIIKRKHKHKNKHKNKHKEKEIKRERRKRKRRVAINENRIENNTEEEEGKRQRPRPRPRKHIPPRPKTPQAPKRTLNAKQKRRKGSKAPPPTLQYAASTHTLPNNVMTLRSQSAKAPSIMERHSEMMMMETYSHSNSQSPPDTYNNITSHLSPTSYSNHQLPALTQANSYDGSPASHGSPQRFFNEEKKKRKSSNSMVERAKLMIMNSRSADVNNHHSAEISDEYRRKKKKKSSVDDSSIGTTKKKRKSRSRTRDIGEMVRSLQNESKKKKKVHQSYGSSLAIRGHSHQRSKSLEVNLEDLLAAASDADSDSDSKEMEEYIFTSSSSSSSDNDNDSDDSKDDYDDDTLSLWVGTWNVAENKFLKSGLPRWIGASASFMYRMHDVYIIGLQECVSQHRKNWINGILNYLDSERKQYIIISKMHLMNILLIVIVNKLYRHRIRDIKCKTVACGKGNIIGNKGAVAITLMFDETSFAFINVHLVARAERFIQRMENIERIFKNIDSAAMGTFERIDCLNQFHHVIFFGDLNYRIMKDFWQVCDLIKRRKFSSFVRFDQLNHQKETNCILYNFAEGNISLFPPSYRWERDRNIVSNKREQAPSYTDRILYKSLPECYSFWQTKYKSCMKCFGSDHRPIMSIFRFVPRCLPRHTKKTRKLKNIEISFYEIRAYIDTRNNKVNSLEITDKISCTLYYKYSTNYDYKYVIDGGKYDNKHQCWCWSLNVLDSVKIIPYILNPQFLVTTHVYVQIVNVNKYNSIIGYSVIPLFYVFPHSLVNREKIKIKYNPLFASKKDKKNRLNDKEFNSPITIHGTYIGDIKGFIHAHSDLVEKHRKITTKQKYK